MRTNGSFHRQWWSTTPPGTVTRYPTQSRYRGTNNRLIMQAVFTHFNNSLKAKRDTILISKGPFKYNATLQSDYVNSGVMWRVWSSTMERYKGV